MSSKFNTSVTLIAIFLFTFSILSAQTFNKTYSIGTYVFAQSFPSEDNQTISVSIMYKKIYLLKTDNEGNAVWAKEYSFEDHTNSPDFYNCAAKTNDGGFVVFRSGIIWDGTGVSLYLIKFSSEGEHIWTKSLGYSEMLYHASSVVQTPSGNFVVVAEKEKNILLINTDEEGNMDWFKSLYFDDASENYPANLLLLNDSSFLLRRANNLIAYNADGTVLWQKETDFETSFAASTADGNIVVSGIDKLSKISPQGDEIWKRNFHGEINFAQGMKDLTITLLIDYRKVASLTNYGVLLWEKELANASETKYLFSVAETEDHYILISGRGTAWGEEAGLIKMDAEGNFTTFDLSNVRGLKKTASDEYYINSYEKIYFHWKTPNVSFINIEYTTDGGNSWITVEENFPSDSSYYEMTVPNTPGENCRVRISDPNFPEKNDVNVYAFTIYDYIDYDYIAANEALMWVGNNGDGSHDPRTDGSGFYWPGGEDATLTSIFEDGLIFGGKVNGEIRVNGNTHRQGLYPGPIFDDGTLPDEKDPRFKLFKLKKNWEQLPQGLERDKYENNYDNWPMEYGAPYEDVNNDGEYTPGVDTPKILGDETIFYVANGFDSTRSEFTYGSPPLPLEFQTTVWAYNDFGMENVVFKKYKIINKGNIPIEDMYLSYWADPDLGYANDDNIGCDTLLNLGYCYNGDETDEFFYESPPPAVGHMIIQGPIVESTESDSAFTGEEWIKGFKNMPLTSFTAYIGGSFNYRDPLQGVYEGTLEMYNYIKGYQLDGSPFIDPNTGKETQIMLSGDPVEGIGWYMGDGWPDGPVAGDMRGIITSGPLILAPGESQEFVVAIFMAQGTDRLNSITKLKEKAIEIHEFYSGRIVSDVREEDDNQPLTFRLEQNYPNPYNPTTTIVYQLPKASKVSLKVYNILGKEVAELVNAEQNPGTYKVSFNGNRLASGVYFYRLTAGNFVASKKMILLK